MFKSESLIAALILAFVGGCNPPPGTGSIRSADESVQVSNETAAVNGKNCSLTEKISFFQGVYYTLLTDPKSQLSFVDMVYFIIKKHPDFAKRRIRTFLERRLRDLRSLESKSESVEAEIVAIENVWLTATNPGQTSREVVVTETEQTIDLNNMSAEEQAQLEEIMKLLQVETCGENVEEPE